MCNVAQQLLPEGVLQFSCWTGKLDQRRHDWHPTWNLTCITTTCCCSAAGQTVDLEQPDRMSI
jgi:hypothetical protein